jgi:hypothetical protein
VIAPGELIDKTALREIQDRRRSDAAQLRAVAAFPRDWSI